MLAFPSIMGYPFRGIASSAALRAPVFRQLLEWIGVVDADRKNCENILNNDGIIGISTGGVAEVFETDAQMEGDGDECIVLHCRKGLVKLAFRTGDKKQKTKNMQYTKSFIHRHQSLNTFFLLKMQYRL